MQSLAEGSKAVSSLDRTAYHDRPNATPNQFIAGTIPLANLPKTSSSSLGSSLRRSDEPGNGRGVATGGGESLNEHRPGNLAYRSPPPWRARDTDAQRVGLDEMVSGHEQVDYVLWNGEGRTTGKELKEELAVAPESSQVERDRPQVSYGSNSDDDFVESVDALFKESPSWNAEKSEEKIFYDQRTYTGKGVGRGALVAILSGGRHVTQRPGFTAKSENPFRDVERAPEALKERHRSFSGNRRRDLVSVNDIGKGEFTFETTEETARHRSGQHRTLPAERRKAALHSQLTEYDTQFDPRECDREGYYHYSTPRISGRDRARSFSSSDEGSRAPSGCRPDKSEPYACCDKNCHGSSRMARNHDGARMCRKDATPLKVRWELQSRGSMEQPDDDRTGRTNVFTPIIGRRQSATDMYLSLSDTEDSQEDYPCNIKRRVNSRTNYRRSRNNIEGIESPNRGSKFDYHDLKMEKRQCERSTLHNSDEELNDNHRVSRNSRFVMKPSKFDGSTSVDTFLIQFQTCAEYNGWSDKEKSAHLKCCLSGSVGQILWETDDPNHLSYKELVAKLKSRYGAAGQRELFIAQLRSRRRRPNETLAELHRDIRRLMALSYPKTSGSELNEEIAKSYFLTALGDRKLELKVREREPADLDAAFTIAVRLEAYQQSCLEQQSKETKDIKLLRVRNTDGLPGRVAAIEQKLKDSETIDSRCEELRRLLDGERREKERVTRELGRLKLLDEQRRAREVVAPSATTGGVDRKTRSETPVKCFRCKGLGHFARDCRAFESAAANRSAATNQSDPDNARESQSAENHGTCGQVSGAETGSAAREVYLRLKIWGRTMNCLLDTGSEVTLIPAKLIGKRPVQPSSQKLLAANGTTIDVLGQVTIDAKGGHHLFTIHGFVSNHVVEVILGIDFLQSQKALWCFERSEVVLNGHRYKLLSREPTKWTRRVVAAHDVSVPKRSECLIPSYVIFNGSPRAANGPSDGWVTEQGRSVNGLRVSRVLVPDRSYDLPVRVLNMGKDEVLVAAGTVLADLQPALNVEEPVKLQGLPEARLQLINELVAGLDEEVPDSIRNQLKQMLETYSAVFSTSEHDLGRTNVAKHEINTGDAKPIRQPLRRHPPAHLAAIQEHVSTMLQQGVIERTQSPWASNIVLVKKKDGTLRCCVDYRQLNMVTKKDAYPLPHTDVCLDAMTGAQWFSTFDLRSSYHQVEVRPEDADKTAFICREGLFKFVTMPFGLCGAPATFQRLMDVVMAGLNFDICLVYLDDIIIFSDSLSSHLERLALVLDRILISGLKIKPSKTHLMQRSVKFLGHVISCRGIEPQAEKVAAVENWPTPKCVRDLKAFLGLCGYYRRFMEGFANMASPLYELLQKGRSFEWTDRCQQAFDWLKSSLISSPVLGMPNDKDAFVLDTDASDETIGAVLSQVQNGQEKVIAYASRRLSQSERNYCITRRELLAVVNFIKYFRHYILGRPFTVRTDHAALRWLKRVPEPIGQQARWLELLEEYDFEIVHRSGSRHGNADAMSRRPCDRSRCCKASTSVDDETRAVCELGSPAKCFNVVAEGPDHADEWSTEALATDQERDADVGPLFTLKKLGERKPDWDDVAHLSETSKSLWRQWDRLQMFRGVLVRRFEKPEGGVECWQTVMPTTRRLSFVRLLHEGATGGHLGRKRTERQVQLRAYWPGWSTDVRKVLHACTPCARYHRGRAPHQTPLKPFVAGEPWEVVSIDITGPHPKSRRGHVYILTLVDHFSKWAEALPIRKHTASTVARVLFDHIFSRFGMPVRCLSDQGAEFESVMFKELCQLMNIHKIRTSPYRPSTNAVVERFHRTLNSMLAKVISENQRDWCEHLPSVMTAYRASVHESTQFSPNKIMFGRENRLPADIVLGRPADEIMYGTVNEYVEQTEARQRSDFALVRQHLGKAALRRKERYDGGMKRCAFIPGQLVWYFYPRKRPSLSPKWQSWYTGPYTVVREIDSHNLVIRKSKKSKCIVVHRDKLKTCNFEIPSATCTGIADEIPSYKPINNNDRTNENAKGCIELPEVDNTETLSVLSSDSEIENARYERSKRSIRLPKHLSNYVVGSIYRDESQAWMASRQIEAAREQGLCCNVCHRFFSQRHGLKYHLERYRQDPAHDAFARETLDSWRNRGRPRLESHDVDRRRGYDGESRRQSRPDGSASFRHSDAKYPPLSVRTVSMVDNPFAAAYMFGAMAASMSMFANPCWPVRNETAAGTEATSESTESVSVPSRTAWPNFPGYPFMRWPQP
jgi:hypothetical protein